MKIGILTFHTPINYGAVLQAYALQQFLKINYPQDIILNIDFKTKKHLSEYNILLPFRRNIPIYCFRQMCVMLRYNKLKNRKDKFQKFVREELSLSQRYVSETDLLNNVEYMDRYIVGSDQVFHPSSEYLLSYYLGFKKQLKSKKIAYAPSFGLSEIKEEDQEKIRPLLNDFDSLSCRESSGAKIISEIINKKVETVLDPVFLLSKEEWRKMSIKPKIKGKYIFIYDLNGGYDLVKIAKHIQNLTGYKIVCQTQTSHHFYDVDYQIYDSGPREFVGLVDGSEYVITDSFHGTAFSVLFEKEQLVYIAKPHASSRIRSLLNLCNLNSRIIENGKVIDFNYTTSFNGYDSLKFDELILKSKEYLINSLI